jgi:hypothetical protein
MMNRIAFNSLKRLSTFSVAVCLIVAACKQKAEHHYVGPDSSQAIVVSTEANSFEDSGDTIEVNGTWLGSLFPRNKAHLKADKQTMTLRIADAVIVDFARPSMLKAELDEHKIEEWTDERITTTKTRCGTSERFVRIVIDRKAKEVAREFTGEYPARILLGDGITQFTNATDYRKQK